MTEAEWLSCADPALMVKFLRSKVNDRKLRLVLVGYCHQVWDLLSEHGRRPLAVAERYADGMATAEELEEAMYMADNAAVDADMWHQQAQDDRWLAGLSAEEDEAVLHEIDYRSRQLHAAMTVHTATFPMSWLRSQDFASLKEAGCKLLRDVVGNPFHSVTCNPAWLVWNNGMVRLIAQTIYDQRAFDRMPILADALEDAGCNNADILNHCRQPGVHVRGCWVVDLLLGKE